MPLEQNIKLIIASWQGNPTPLDKIHNAYVSHFIRLESQLIGNHPTQPTACVVIWHLKSNARNICQFTDRTSFVVALYA